LPSPIGHSLFGLVIFYLFKRQIMRWNFLLLFLVIFISNLPDLDFLPGFFVGEPNRYHHGISHSLGFLMILTGLIYFCVNFWDKTKSKIISGWFLLFSSFHVILDFFAVDTTLPFGEPMFWPIWNSYVISPFSIFIDIRRSNDINQFFPSLFSLHNLKAVMIEIVFVICVWILLDRILKLKFRNSLEHN
jgi:inner membrane protein